MNILGLYGAVGWCVSVQKWLHSAGASLISDGKVLGSISEERLSREKYDGNYPQNSIEYLLKDNNLSEEDITHIAYSLSIHTANSIENWGLIEDILKRQFPNAEISFVDHHLAHVFVAIAASGFESCSVLSVDGSGNSEPIYDSNFRVVSAENETGLYAIMDHKSFLVYKRFMNRPFVSSVFNSGNVYNNVSRYVYAQMEPARTSRFTNPFLFMEQAPGKIMGLSAYGDKKGERMLFIRDDSYFPVIGDHVDETEMKKFDPKDIAFWLQSDFQTSFVEFFDRLPLVSKMKNLVLAGGCFLNVLANRELLDRCGFKEVFIYPATNDNGLCLGAAIYRSIKEGWDIQWPKGKVYLGKEYLSNEIKHVLTERIGDD